MIIEKLLDMGVGQSCLKAVGMRDSCGINFKDTPQGPLQTGLPNAKLEVCNLSFFLFAFLLLHLLLLSFSSVFSRFKKMVKWRMEDSPLSFTSGPCVLKKVRTTLFSPHNWETTLHSLPISFNGPY